MHYHCIHGHEWDQAGEVSPVGLTTSCPTCGAPPASDSADQSSDTLSPVPTVSAPSQAPSPDAPTLADDAAPSFDPLGVTNESLPPQAPPQNKADDSWATQANPPSAPPARRVTTTMDWPSIPGYDIQAELGRGGMGVVYRAFDQARNQIVALKTLQELNPGSLFRFKQEFRALADVAHPNLVSLYELLSDGQEWAFTMELVEGLDFCAHVRSAPAEPDAGAGLSPAQEGLLRSTLRALVEGIMALHQAGKLHRDIKPSNVMVTREGRVVLLDFGLAADLKESGSYQSTEQHIVGTVAYMAPEQAASLPVSPASDWYSVGVMLYEVLTGALPFQGRGLQVLIDKQNIDPPPPSTSVPNLPQDLADLCVALLRRDPSARPQGPDILRRLGEKQPDMPRASTPAPRSPEKGTGLLGRDPHLAALHDAFLKMSQGSAVLVCVQGMSGAGKSALAQFFVDDLAARGKAVILSGRSYEQESVPYKALDSLVDELSTYLGRLPDLEAQALLPRDIVRLTKIFPVLRRVAAVANAPRRSFDSPDPQEVRRRASAALRELLGRLGDRKALVLYLDDLQWGDVDSAALLLEMLRPPDPPTLLLIACYRGEDVATSAFLQLFLPELDKMDLDRRQVAVEPLPAEQARALARTLLRERNPAWTVHAERIAQESRGNPFFVHELIHHIQTTAGPASLPAGDLALDKVLWMRIERLPEEARRLLETIAVAGRPIPQAMACKTAQIEGKERTALAVLRSGRLMRSKGQAVDDAVETYHDRVREAVLANLAPAVKKECHRRLAASLEASAQADPELLAVHFEGAEEFPRAGHYYALAADQAADALAFDRAARLYQRALERLPAGDEGAQALRRKLAEALANAGRGSLAAQAFLRAAEDAVDLEKLELRRRAAEQLLWSGHIDQGMDVIRAALASMGLKLAKTPGRALVSIVLRGIYLWFRGLGFRERAASTISPQELLHVDTCWSVALGLSHVDPVRGADYQMRHLLLALRVGEPYRVARAIAMEVAQSSCGGGPKHQRTEKLFGIAMGLAEKVQHPHALGLTLLAGGIAAFMEGFWKKAFELCERGAGILRERCTGVAWELHGVNFYGVRALEFLGSWGELQRRLPILIKDAEDRGDLFAATNLRTRLSYLTLLMADEPAAAAAELAAAMARWSNEGVHLQHYFELSAKVDIALYSGNSDGAWELLDRQWAVLSRSLLLRVQSSRITMYQMRARIALAMLTRRGAEGTGSDIFWRACEQDVQRIARENMGWSNPIGLLAQAGMASIRGQTEAAVQLLTTAEAGFQAADMGLFESVARRCRGLLLGGQQGSSLIASADTSMKDQKIVNPARIAAMYAPGFPE